MRPTPGGATTAPLDTSGSRGRRGRQGYTPRHHTDGDPDMNAHGDNAGVVFAADAFDPASRA